MTRFLLALALALQVNAQFTIKSLTPKNYKAELNAAKHVFIRFRKRQCQPCNRYASDWSDIGRRYADRKDILIGEVMCDGPGKDICLREKVKEWPLYKYGNNETLNPWFGEHDFNTISDFIQVNMDLGMCGPLKLDRCDESEKTVVEKLMKIPIGDLKRKIDKKEYHIIKIDKGLKEKVESIEEAEENFFREADGTVMQAQLGKVFEGWMKEGKTQEEAEKEAGSKDPYLKQVRKEADDHKRKADMKYKKMKESYKESARARKQKIIFTEGLRIMKEVMRHRVRILEEKDRAKREKEAAETEVKRAQAREKSKKERLEKEAKEKEAKKEDL